MNTRVPASLFATLLLLVSCSEDAPPSETSGAFSYDPECDGAPEICTVLRYDAHGRQIYSAADTDCDGQRDSGAACNHTQYDEDGNITRLDVDMECDGKPERCEFSQRDEHGNRLDGTDEDCDGDVDAGCTLFSGASGVTVLLEEDDDCDGTPNLCTVVTKRANGSVERVEDDSDCDGAAGPCGDSSTYDEDGHQTFTNLDGACDGTPEYCLTRSYDANGALAWTELDFDCDGTLDICTEFSIRSEHELVIRTDDDCDGIPDKCEVERHDEAGELIGGGLDSDCDGEADSACTTYVVEGSTHIVQYDADCDGTPETCSLTTYDGDLLTSAGDDNDCDGTADAQCYRYSRG